MTYDQAVQIVKEAMRGGVTVRVEWFDTMEEFRVTLETKSGGRLTTTYYETAIRESAPRKRAV